MNARTLLATAAALSISAAVFAADAGVKTFRFPAQPIGTLDLNIRGSFATTVYKSATGVVPGVATYSVVLHPDPMQVTKPGYWEKVPANIEGVDLTGAEVGTDVLRDMSKRFKNIRILTLTDSDVDDGVFEVLPAFKELEALDMASVDINGSGLKHLKNCANLKHLRLRTVPVHGEQLKPIGDISGLVELNISETGFNDDTAKAISKLSHLKRLDLAKTTVTGKGLENLVPLHKTLLLLDITTCDITDDGLKPISKLDHLTSLLLRTNRVKAYSAKGIQNLQGAKALQDLDFGMSKIQDDVLQAVPKYIPQTRSLYLQKCYVLTDKGFAAVGQLKHLQSIYASETKAGDGLLDAAKSLPVLYNLELGNTRITDAGLKRFCDAAGPVRVLSVDNSVGVSDKGVVSIWKLPNLLQLTLMADDITDASVPYLSKAKSLRELGIKHTKITPAGVEALRKALPQCAVRY